MNSKNIIASVVAGLLFVGIGACERKGPAERAGAKIDNAADKAGDKMEKAGDKVQDAARDSKN